MAGQRTLVVGTRGSRLALAQTALVTQRLRDEHPALRIDVREVRTEGDRRATDSLALIGGQGVFVKELEAALLRGEIDLAVHSAKDVPSEIAPGLRLAAVPQRADSRDALVSQNGARLAELPAGASIGTGSARRAVQLRALRQDVSPVDIRGNVDSRVRKVDAGEVDAVVLAVAGLERLGLQDRAAEVFSAETVVPAVGQGALVVEARADDAATLEIVCAIDERDAHLALRTERAFLGRLGGGCRLPFGALAEVDAETITVRGFISDEAGAHAFRSEVSGAASDAESLGVALAERLLAQGAREFVEAQTP